MKKSDYPDRFAEHLSWARFEADPALPDWEQDEQVIQDIMQLIVEQCDWHISGKSGLFEEDFEGMSVEEHAFKPALTLHQAAWFIYRAMEQVERETHELCTKSREWPRKPLPTVEELTKQIEGDALCFKGGAFGPDAA
jgi:hypothetical protein